ncbi:MAG: DUF5591 domain-containing protein [Methanomassiliicoccales archaeon]|nr:DUF5591 domain-containing protein [Methanomassiliicoccales archaeon]
MARWSENGLKISTPAILYYNSKTCPAPEHADLIIEGENAADLLNLGPRLSSIPKVSLPNDLKVPISVLKRDGASLVSVGNRSVVVRGDVGDGSSKVLDTDTLICVLGSGFELRRDARGFVRSLVALRKTVGHGRLIYVPGIMDVSNFALLVYLGVDLVDSSLLIYQGARGRLLTPEGVLNADDAGWLVSSPDPGNAMGFNLDAAGRELALIRHMLKLGRLRELVEMRITSSPWSVAALRIFDLEFYGFQEPYAPVVGPRFFCNAKQSLYRPDVRRFRRRVMERYVPPAHKKVLLLIPCSAKKPYSTSRSHRLFSQTIQAVRNNSLVHEVIVTSPLGIVPRELELLYPAAQYDIPVTGHWDRDEIAMVQEMVLRIRSFGYDKVISHLSYEEAFVKDAVDCIDTSSGRPASKDSLERLREELEGFCPLQPFVGKGIDRVGCIGSLARFQFGEGGERLVEGVSVVGNYPYLRILEGNDQIAMLTPERGMLSLTLRGGEKLLPQGINWVEMDDFDLEGNLFAVGVKDADRGIRSGDEVLVIRNGELEAVGVASMCGEEMIEAKRGEAVKIRHKRKIKPDG